MNLLELLKNHPTLPQVVDTLQKNEAVAVTGAPSASWGTVASFLCLEQQRTLLLIAPDGEAADRCANDISALFETVDGETPEILQFPIPERAGVEDVEGDRGATQERLAALDALHRDKPVVVISTANALAHPTLPPYELRHGYDEIAKGQTLDREQFVEHLASTGYERVETVEAPGQFAARGGIIDFYPPASGIAIRLELWGDEVDSLRHFDAETQRSTDKIPSVRLTPPREIYLSLKKGREAAAVLEKLLEKQTTALEIEGKTHESEHLAEVGARDIERLRHGTYFPGLDRYRSLLYPNHPTLLEHLPDNALVIWADPNRAQIQIDRLIEEDATAREGSANAGAAIALPEAPFVAFEELRKRSSASARADLHMTPEVPDGGENIPSISLDIHLPPSFGGKLDVFLDWMRGRQRKDGTIILATAHGRRVREILADGDIRHVHLLDAINEPQPSLVLIMPQRLTAGFSFEAPAKRAKGPDAFTGISILTDAEMFGWQRLQARPSKRKAAAKKPTKSEKASVLTDLAALREGDYVVHINHGIARYAGVVRQEIAGAVNDYLLLEYEGSDRLYVPVGQLDRVQKYLGADTAVPPLNQLRGNTWERTKKKVREEAEQVAKQLSELYAAREQATKEPISGDTPWQREMESAFPYEETEGQLQAIKDVKNDLESDKPMDRLVCGDVGFGKTEVAVRAAFKVVQEGKQVAVLVPTTVLAQQHFQTFSERLAPYPTRIEVISRFRTPGEQRKIIEEVKQGAVDILVGTHRLVQKDVEFRDLGLVIVDEEQRFGVMQKERLKEMRKQVDILTLSATPIPRTLHFALGGLREMSLITDPPAGRLPVRTFVMPYKDELVRSAIEREIEREGQVYYVHNRISSIYHVAERLRALVPHARIGIGHGQMGDEELEQVMLDFMHHRTDVLLATTIIENGLDLPNVNTLMVDRAELLGLSQMYQLRGRVGRSPRQGYAYFFSGSRGKLGEEAESRFAAMQEYTDLGAGFKIAMRDLEIRGAGDLLGVRQSGGIASVGFELYTEMLSDAVRRIRHEPIVRREELPEADLPVPAFLPDDYIPQESDRLYLYRKMAGIESLDEVRHLQDELRDRFGALPTPAFNLIRILKIRVYLLHARVRGISKTESEVLIRLKPGDRFADEDTAAVYTRLNNSFDQRVLQNIGLRPLEGIIIDTRPMSPTQLLRMVEEMCEALAAVRSARLLGHG
jgi:transcription-repair coupling factor (superfamily II helicase)